MRYEGSIYRPPSEADAYILQATIGCSWNKCTYCDMYRDKEFAVRALDEVLADIALAGETYGQSVQKVFVADGDALILLAQALAAGERLEEALLRYETAAQITGFEAKATKLHGELLVSRKRYAEAIPLLKASLQYESDEKVARFLELVEKAARQSAR